LEKSLKIYITFGIFYIVLVLFIVIPIHYYVAQPFLVDGEAMNPTYKNKIISLLTGLIMSLTEGML